MSISPVRSFYLANLPGSVLQLGAPTCAELRPGNAPAILVYRAVANPDAEPVQSLPDPLLSIQHPKDGHVQRITGQQRTVGDPVERAPKTPGGKYLVQRLKEVWSRFIIYKCLNASH
jgi:hypothetical protein